MDKFLKDLFIILVKVFGTQQPPLSRGVTSYANLAAFPSSGNTAGDYAFATDTKALYVWDGAEWDRVSTGNNETPRLTTTPASALSLEADGSTSQLVIAAEDPEVFQLRIHMIQVQQVQIR